MLVLFDVSFLFFVLLFRCFQFVVHTHIYAYSKHQRVHGADTKMNEYEDTDLIAWGLFSVSVRPSALAQHGQKKCIMETYLQINLDGKIRTCFRETCVGGS